MIFHHFLSYRHVSFDWLMGPFWDCKASVAKTHLECNLFTEKIYVSKRHPIFSLMFALKTASHMKILLDIFDYHNFLFYFYCLEIISRCLFQPSLVLNFWISSFPFKFCFKIEFKIGSFLRLFLSWWLVNSSQQQSLWTTGDLFSNLFL